MSKEYTRKDGYRYCMNLWKWIADEIENGSDKYFIELKANWPGWEKVKKDHGFSSVFIDDGANCPCCIITKMVPDATCNNCLPKLWGNYCGSFNSQYTKLQRLYYKESSTQRKQAISLCLEISNAARAAYRRELRLATPGRSSAPK